MPIGEAARRFGVAVSALRYWEECGLLAPAARRSGRRWYGADDLHRIALIRMWQDTGLMSLEEIAAVLAGSTAGRSWRETVDGRLRAIDEQVQRLAASRAFLEHLLTCPNEDPAGSCPYLRATTRQWIETGVPPYAEPGPGVPGRMPERD